MRCLDNKFTVSHIGTILIISGSVISVIGAFANNIWLDHIIAMEFWRFSNIILLLWAVGLYRKWWNGGLPVICLCGMYAFYMVTNEIGLG